MLSTSKYRFIFPNLLTLTSLALGIISITELFRKNYSNAIWLSFLCMLFDKFDGATARKLNAQSNFGLEMDSLADLVAFGITPSIIFYVITIRFSPFFSTVWHSYILVAIAVFWGTASALRLAKYNVVAQSNRFDQIFQGFPMPVAAGLILSPLLLYLKYFSFGGYNHLFWDPTLFSSSNSTTFFNFYPLWVTIIAYGMISKLKIPKMKPPKSGFRRYWFMGNGFMLYAIIAFRAFPELLLFLALQFLVISFWFHLFSPNAKNSEYISLLEAMSFGSENNSDISS